jgi:hypothetical protein
MDIGQFREHIVRPTLEAITLWAPAAEELLIATAVHESAGLKYIRQVGGGPALSFYQIEPETAEDLIKRYIFGDKSAFGRTLRIVSQFEPGHMLRPRLLGDMTFATVIARLKYWSIPQPLPKAGDVPAMALYWKRWYNTPLGKGREQEFIANYERFVK